MNQVYQNRPFKTRNADEFELSDILNLFVNPIKSLNSPFDYENNIIKGKMGSGKTMFLRANHAYYLYRLIPSLTNKLDNIILPVFIKLNRYQHIKKAELIYNAIIIDIIEELSSIYLKLQDAKYMANIHLGVKNINIDLDFNSKINSVIKELKLLSCEEFTEKVLKDLSFEGSLKPKFFEASAKYKKEEITEIKAKKNPGINDVERCYKYLLDDQHGKILLLLDEAGALDKTFFNSESNDSFFEILMNQLRTCDFIRTKVAIYPNSYQDILTETRYGDAIRLEETIYNEAGYIKFRKQGIELIQNYINETLLDREVAVKPNELFEIFITKNYGDCLEQLINASDGNMRRLIHLLDKSMTTAYERNKGNSKVKTIDVIEALKRNAFDNNSLFNDTDKGLLNNIVLTCKARSTYKFQFPNKSNILNKFTSKSQEQNILKIEEIGSGRKGTVYSFDYSFCILHDLPTHHTLGSEKLNKKRTLDKGKWIGRIAKISDKLIEHASISIKEEGAIEFIKDNKGFIKSDTKKEFFFSTDFIIDEDKNKNLIQGRRVRFIPYDFGELQIAQGIEIL